MRARTNLLEIHSVCGNAIEREDTLTDEFVVDCFHCMSRDMQQLMLRLLDAQNRIERLEAEVRALRRPEPRERRAA